MGSMSDEFIGELELPSYEVEDDDENVLDGGRSQWWPAPDEETYTEWLSWLIDEHYAAKEEWQNERLRWSKWRKQVANIRENEVKNYPYPNSSNVPSTLMESVTQTLYGKLKTMFSVRDPFWTVKTQKPQDEESVKQAETLTKWFNIIAESPSDLNIREKNRTILLEASYMPMCMVMVPFLQKEIHFANAEGTEVRSGYQHNGPAVTPIQREFILYRKGYSTIDDMPWISYTMPLSWHTLKERGARGTYRNVEDVIPHGRTGEDEWEFLEADSERELDGDRDEKSMVYDITTVHFYADFFETGKMIDFIWTIHIPSKQVLKTQVNILGERPFAPFIYMHRNWHLQGVGTGQMLEYLQDESTGLKNLNNDNAKVGSMKMIIARPGAGLSAKERVYPGKIVLMPDPKNDVNSLSLGDMNPGLVQARQQTEQEGRQVTGMSEAMAGFPDSSVKGRDTWRGQTQRVQMGQGVFGSIAEGLAGSFSKVGRLIYMQAVLHKDTVMGRERELGRMSEEDLEILEKALSIPIDEISDRVTFTVESTDVEETAEAKAEVSQMLFGMYSTFAQQAVPYIQMLFGPEGQQFAQASPEGYQHLLKIYEGGVNLMSDIFKYQNRPDVDKYLPRMDRVRQLQAILDRMVNGMQELQSPGQRPGVEGPPPQGPPPEGDPMAEDTGGMM